MIMPCFKTKSIHKRLILFLFAIVFSVWILTTFTSYMSIKGQIERLVDWQLTQFAQSLVEINFEQLENNNPTMSQDKAEFLKITQNNPHFHYQIWEGEKLISHSSQAIQKQIAFKQKFTDVDFAGKHWRVFTLIPYGEKKFHIEVMANKDIYASFLAPISKVVSLNQFFEFVLLAILLWFAVSVGLWPLQSLAKTIRTRDYKDLTPIDEQDVPHEIEPVINAINELFERLHSSFESEREFTGHAAHELRTPLAALKMQAQVALQENDKKKQAQLLEKISTGVDRASYLVDQLLILARIDSSEEEAEFKELSLNQVVKPILSELSEKAKSKAIEIVFELQSDKKISGHLPALQILFRNILDNALNYSPENSSISIRIYDDSTYIYLSVTDQGPGIEENLRKQVLKKFVRLPGTKAQGTGLGLAIVKKIAAFHKASLSLQYGPDRTGLCVTVRFQRSD